MKKLEINKTELDILLDYIGRIKADIKTDIRDEINDWDPRFKRQITMLWNKLVKLHNE